MKKPILTILTFLLAILLTGPIFGQNKFGVNISTFLFPQSERYSVENDGFLHYNAGVFYSLNLHKYYSIRGGVNYLSYKHEYISDRFWDYDVIAFGKTYNTIRQQSIEFPVEAVLQTYCKNSGKKAFHLTFGVIPTMHYSYSRTTKPAVWETVMSYASEDNWWQVGLSVGMGIQVKLPNKMVLNIEPQYRHYLSNEYRRSPVENSYGIRAQLLFDFSKKEG